MAMFMFTTLAILVAQATSTLAHDGVTSFSIGGVRYQCWQPLVRAEEVTAGRPYTYDPILDPVGSTLHCNNAVGP
ncbi:unnamed protein product [Rhizoctonia solani]|uniref:Secreted protein n=1 Tax=Rhizoctonia solani TaxID=456999 RepID=A0A8H3BI89_9AGAM|nr:unnamed protein product [Rhizoctonia solani]